MVEFEAKVLEAFPTLLSSCPLVVIGMPRVRASASPMQARHLIADQLRQPVACLADLIGWSAPKRSDGSDNSLLWQAGVQWRHVRHVIRLHCIKTR